jgi:hypothetical protein
VPGKSVQAAIAVLLVAVLWLPLASTGIAAPGGGLTTLKNSLSGDPIVEKTHGFHCRPMFGWDPRLGIYHWHKHEGICRNYQRCMKVMYRCDLRGGRGWRPWDYERWGNDNWRFDKCMLDAGCY